MVILVNLGWCFRQKNGISLIDPNNNLSSEYMQSSEETLESLKDGKEKSRMWLATKKYYCEYLASYALLMRLGIKCEIHECTIAVCRFLEQEKLMPTGYSEMLDDDKKLRIDNQYYLRNREVNISYPRLLEYVLTIKNIIQKINEKQINEIRRKIKTSAKIK